MKIAVDARPLCIGQASGIPIYLRNLLTAISQRDRKNRYYLYAHRPFQWQGEPGFQYRIRTGTNIYGTVWMQTVVPLWLRQDKIDVFWGTQHILPLLASQRIRMVLTVHDLIYLRLPETMEIKNLWINRAFIKPSIHRAQLVVADSKNTAIDVVELMNIAPERIQVTYLGIESNFVPENKSAAKAKIKEILKTDGPFFLTVGTMEPRKNLSRVLAAFFRFAKKWPHSLYIVGPPGWKMEQMQKRFGIPDIQNRLKFLGYMPRELMPSLYSAADAFLFPSLYEGFGLPPLEAMACGTPVVSSNSSCLPEVLGGCAVFVDPLDIKAIETAMERLITEKPLREHLIRDGLVHASRFRWSETAGKMVTVFHDVCQR